MQLVTRVMNLIPPISKMKAFDDAKKFREFLNNLHPLVYPFLLWLLTSNRSHLRRLKTDEVMQNINTPYQYMLLTSAPEREDKFQRQRRQRTSTSDKPTFHNFHGSPFGNWHSILRRGLQIAGAHTGLARSGAAIWMANDFNTSIGYSTKEGHTPGWQNSMFGDKLYCMAMLEVIEDPGSSVLRTNPVNIVGNVELISTRYFLVFKDHIPNSTVTGASIPVRDLAI